MRNKLVRNPYVVAHPEATHHVRRVVGGWHDSQLTSTGARAAASIAEALRSRIPGDAHLKLFSSDLQRARQTAAIVSDVLQVEPVLDRRLREKSYGEAEGRPQEGLDSRFIPPPAVGDRMEHAEGVPEAETKMAFARRAYAVMDAILERCCEHNVIVTHGFAVTFVLASWIRMPIESVGYVNFPAASGGSRCSARTTTSTTAKSSAWVTRAISPPEPSRRTVHRATPLTDVSFTASIGAEGPWEWLAWSKRPGSGYVLR